MINVGTNAYLMKRTEEYNQRGVLGVLAPNASNTAMRSAFLEVNTLHRDTTIEHISHTRYTLDSLSILTTRYSL